MTKLQFVSKINNLLKDETCWTKHSLALDAKGKPCHPKDKAAVKFCLFGAGMHVDAYDYSIGKIFKEANITETQSVVVWNDDPATTFDDIKRGLNKVLLYLREQELKK